MVSMLPPLMLISVGTSAVLLAGEPRETSNWEGNRYPPKKRVQIGFRLLESVARDTWCLGAEHVSHESVCVEVIAHSILPQQSEERFTFVIRDIEAGSIQNFEVLYGSQSE